VLCLKTTAVSQAWRGMHMSTDLFTVYRAGTGSCPCS
jgi:hypothetical protein